MTHHKSKFALLFLVAAACEGGAATFPNDGELKENLLVPGATYSDLRALENAFPIPSGSQNINVGTLDPSTGQFTGLQGDRQCSIDPITHKPRCVTFPPSVDISAVGAVLVFRTPYYLAPFRVTINGVTTTAPSGATTLSVDVRRAKSVQWTLQV